MKNTIVNDFLPKPAILVEEAETQIRLIVKEEYIKGTSLFLIEKKINKVISETLKKIKIEDLRKVVKKSLWTFFKKQYQTIKQAPRGELLTAVALSNYLQTKRLTADDRKILRGQGIEVKQSKVYTPNLYGVPVQEFSKTYFRKVKSVFGKLIHEQARDPDDISGRNTLRNRAEMEVRYNHNLEQINELKSSGAKLVIASTHADCSERCAPWQGRVYSLDGTSGITSDGRKFVPLETATDIYYTTKAGKTYKNGLLGFNCRHYLVPYEKGFKFPKFSQSVEKKEYKITEQQRAFEREIRKWKTRAVEYKDVDREQFKEAKTKAIFWNNKYKEFSKENNRAFYPSRTDIF